ncbi:TonB family protein [Ideonella sp.]|uniref:TonB family protein n=1 Tax=Ideonella sp. TaxID=1929293 RepID=UPI0035B31DD7
MIAFVGRHPLATAGLALLAGACPAWAQAPAVPAPVADEKVSERVKKDAASPLYWIRLNAQKADGASRPAAPRITEVRTAPAVRPVAASVAPSGATAPAIASRPSAGTPGSAAVSRREAEGEATAILAAPAPLASPAEVAAAAAAATAALALPSAASAPRPDLLPPPDESEEAEPLSLLAAGEPEFPAAMMRKLRRGNVQVRFEVQPDGRVAEASVVQTSHRGLNAAAVQAVQAWQFKPVKAPRTAVVDLGFDLDG